MTSTPPMQQPRTPWVEIALAALPAALHALLLLGRLHPDELFQSLEVALNRAYGFGVVPWEWQVPPNPAAATQPWGIRNQAVPMLFAALFKAGDVVGLSSVMARRVLAEVPQFLLHLAMLAAVWRLSLRRVGAPLARVCLWLVALYGPLVWFGGRTMSESFSTAFLVWGLERLDAEEGAPAWAWGGFLLGLAQVTRYGSAAVIVPAMAWLLVTRRWKPFAFAALGGVVAAFGLGLLDRLTWGEWFHSLIHYVRFNLVSGAAAATFGALPWWTYLPRLLVAPFAVLGLLLSARRGAPRPSLLIVSALGYLAILSATAHKEDRFLYPALVLLTVAGAPAFARWAAEAWKRGAAWRAAAITVAAAGAIFFVVSTPYDVQRKEQFQLVVKANPGLTGLVIMNEGMWGSPGFFYVGKNVPWCPCDFPRDGCFQFAARDPRFNRGVYWSNGGEAEKPRDEASKAAFEAAGFHLVEQRGQASLFER